MKLELTISSQSQASTPPNITFDEKGGRIGRDKQCELWLACTDKMISRCHANIYYLHDQFYIRDESANGVYINQAEEAIGHGLSAPISDGDTLTIGHYQLTASVQKITVVKPITAAPPKPSAPPQQNVKKATNIVTPSEFFSPKKAPYKEKPPAANPGLTPISLEDSFTPPNMTIPEGWDNDFAPTSQAIKPQPPLPSPPQKPLLSNTSTKQLITQLLKGMGVESQVPAHLLNEDVMFLIGRTLRVAVSTSIKSSPATNQRQPEAPLSSTKDFFSALLNPKNAHFQRLPALLAENIKALAQHQNNQQQNQQKIQQNTLQQLQEWLSPSTLEADTQSKQAENNQKPLSPKRINEKTWHLYKQRWPQYQKALKRLQNQPNNPAQFKSGEFEKTS
jgi:predicted component of type VI protein secretion system